jgi:hypothetical protein
VSDVVTRPRAINAYVHSALLIVVALPLVYMHLYAGQCHHRPVTNVFVKLYPWLGGERVVTISTHTCTSVSVGLGTSLLFMLFVGTLTHTHVATVALHYFDDALTGNAHEQLDGRHFWRCVCR